MVDETPDARSFVLEVPDDLRAAFRYDAGQFCTFRVHIEGERPAPLLLDVLGPRRRRRAPGHRQARA